MLNLATALTLSLIGAQTATSLDNEFDVALGSAGLSRATAKFDQTMLPFYRQGEFATPLFEACFESPWRVPFIMEMHRRQLAATNQNSLVTVSVASRMLGRGSRRELLGNPIGDAVTRSRQPNALAISLQRMKQRGLIAGEIPNLGAVPKEVQESASLLIEVALDTVIYRRASFLGVTDLDASYTRELATGIMGTDPVIHENLLEFYRSIDLTYLFSAGQDFSAAMLAATSHISTVLPTDAYAFTVKTTWGDIVLTGGSDSQHGSSPVFVLIDTGGNDTYVNVPTNKSTANWLSAVIDTAGDDAYLSNAAIRETPVAKIEDRASGRFQLGPGSAAFGLSYLFDTKGNDLYRSTGTGLGAAIFGVAVVSDWDGDDVYDSYADSQGFGKFGIGILDDLVGNDQYAGFHQVQGVGLTGGVGMLIDRKGNDIYAANDAVLDFPSPQSAEHNVSMAQGAGYGVRLDYVNGKSLSGGIGILFDLEGKDSYSCGVFGQGVGYWEGLGALWDSSGDDSYSGQWYVQGAAAHFAVGYTEDLAGFDSYTALMNMAQGAGHDFSIGMLLDHAGDDRYRGPNLALGAGNANGIGVFVDRLGNDGYEALGVALGQAAEAAKGSLRERAFCFGLFMDLSGTDTYPASFDYIRNGTRAVNWRDRYPAASESQLGVFWDR